MFEYAAPLKSLRTSCVFWTLFGMLSGVKGQERRDPTIPQSMEPFAKLWNASKFLTAKLTLDRTSSVPFEIISYHLELVNETSRPVEVFEPAHNGSLGGFNLYKYEVGNWYGVYGHPFPATLQRIRDVSQDVAERAPSRVLASGERMVFEGPLFGRECMERQKQRKINLSVCTAFWEPGKYAFRYDSAISSNFAEFTVQRASLAAIAVIPSRPELAIEANFKKRVFEDGSAYVVLRCPDGSNVIGVGEIQKTTEWDTFSLDPTLNISDRTRFFRFPITSRIAATREPIEDLDLSLAQNGEVTILLKSKTGKRFSIRLDAQRKVLDLPKEFDPR